MGFTYGTNSLSWVTIVVTGQGVDIIIILADGVI